LRKKKGAGLAFGGRENSLVEFVEEFPISVEKPAVEKGKMEFGVVLFNAFALVNCSPRRTHAKTEIPHGTGEFGDDRTKFFLHFVVCKKKKDIEVGIWEKHTPAVTAKSEQGEPFGSGVVQLKDVLENLLKATIR